MKLAKFRLWGNFIEQFGLLSKKKINYARKEEKEMGKPREWKQSRTPTSRFVLIQTTNELLTTDLNIH